MNWDNAFWCLAGACMLTLLAALMHAGVSDSKACANAGGVLIRGVCIDKASVLELRE